MRSFPLLLALLFTPLVAVAEPEVAPPVTATKIETVDLPITIDYPLLRAMIVRSAFTGPDESTMALDRNEGRQQVRLSDFQIRPVGDLIRVRARVEARIGVTMFKDYISPVFWSGFIEVDQRVGVGRDWILRFRAQDSRIFNAAGEPAVLSDVVWKVLRYAVHKRLDAITVDLSRTVRELQEILPPLFPAALQPRAAAIVSSMRPGPIDVLPEGVRATVRVEAEVDTPDETVPPASFDRTDQEKILALWESFDAFMMAEMLDLNDARLSDEDHDALLEIMLDNRTLFVAALAGGEVGNEFVRERFVSVWRALGPLLRRTLLERKETSLAATLAFFTASDALEVFDRLLGPALGLAISREGLLRLARMMNEPNPPGLDYGISVDKRFKKLLGVGPPPKALSPGSHLLDFLVAPVYAATVAWEVERKAPPRWVWTQKTLTTYLPRVRGLLDGAAESVIRHGTLPERYAPLYRDIVLSFAWQESCYRQFRVKKHTTIPLRSYDNSSVGLMQVNLRVWRGLYDPVALQWDIVYNASVGAEIAETYLRRYTIRKMKKLKYTIDAKTMAEVTYAMYNGGPREFWKFLKRRKTGRFYQSDRLYAQKLHWVKAGDYDKVKQCLVGAP